MHAMKLMNKYTVYELTQGSSQNFFLYTTFWFFQYNNIAKQAKTPFQHLKDEKGLQVKVPKQAQDEYWIPLLQSNTMYGVYQR